MVKLIEFETEEELMELTGLTEIELWEKGFNLDDWDIGFQSDTKLHKTPTEEDIENGFCKDDLLQQRFLKCICFLINIMEVVQKSQK